MRNQLIKDYDYHKKFAIQEKKDTIYFASRALGFAFGALLFNKSGIADFSLTEMIFSEDHVEHLKADPAKIAATKYLNVNNLISIGLGAKTFHPVKWVLINWFNQKMHIKKAEYCQERLMQIEEKHGDILPDFSEETEESVIKSFSKNLIEEMKETDKK